MPGRDVPATDWDGTSQPQSETQSQTHSQPPELHEAKQPMKTTIHGEDSFHLATPEVDLFLTDRGGHLAPVVFHLPTGDASPFALAPWVPAEYPELPPLLSVLRGDFLCLPFGGQAGGPPHGDPANAIWTAVESGPRELRFRMATSDSGATVEKTLSTREGHHAVYIEHTVSGLEGEYSYGNHPVLDLSGLKAGAGRVSVSPFYWGSVYTSLFSDPANGETQCLKPGAVFTDLREVELMAGGTTDLTRYPAREGNDDLVMMASVPATPEQPFAWSAAVLDGYVWFSLKNPADFPCTLLWISNGGRSGSPWNGRHVGRIGIEEVCSHFANGVEVSREDLLSSAGVPTTRQFVADETVSLRLIQIAATVPPGFGRVVEIVPCGPESVIVTGESGAAVTVFVDWKFVASPAGS